MNEIIKAIKSMQKNLSSMEKNTTWMMFTLGIIVGLLVATILFIIFIGVIIR